MKFTEPASSWHPTEGSETKPQSLGSPSGGLQEAQQGLGQSTGMEPHGEGVLGVPGEVARHRGPFSHGCLWSPPPPFCSDSVCLSVCVALTSDLARCLAPLCPPEILSPSQPCSSEISYGQPVSTEEGSGVLVLGTGSWEQDPSPPA